VWHTQGSGKSLTMVFLIRAMRSHPELRRFKIVLVTDRTNLQNQLGDTAGLAGETVKVARNSKQLREMLSQPGPGVVMAMIQKYRDTEGDHGDGLSGSETFGTLNESESILVMVDEAHRSHGSALHANLMNSLPNAARIGFTGTPIIMGKRKKTLEIFGGYLDKYTLTESEADGSTVPIYYEGKTTEAAVAGASKMDDVFFRWFAELTDQQREILQTKYATTAQVLEAPEMIAAKARDILRHYVSTVMPDGFKAMIVATSRKACIRYYDALNAARDELVAEIEALGPEPGDRPFDSLDADEQYLRNAAKQLELLRALDFGR
jgi:type I restriction enzyme R subunit